MGVGAIASSYAAAGGSSFDPLSITWTHAWWASDPGWSNPGNGNAVSSWRDAGTGAKNADQATGAKQPTYRSAYANLGGAPAVEFDGGDGLITTSRLGLAQPNHIYAVIYFNASSEAHATVIDNSGVSRHFLRPSSGGNFTMYAGSTANGSTAVTGAMQFAALFNGASSVLRVNGATSGSVNVGAQSFGDQIFIGAYSASSLYLTGAIAFLGVNDVALTSTELDDLSAWAASTYGVPAL